MLPQLPDPLLSLVCLYLPWYDRLLHVSHVHRQLPSVSQVWAEHDHVRLSRPLWDALSQLRPSAVHCAQHVQSLCVEESTDNMDEWLLEVLHNGNTPCPRPTGTYGLRSCACSPPATCTRLERCLQAVQQADSSSLSSLPLFGDLRLLVASYTVFHRLLHCSAGFPYLHSLSLYSSAHYGDYLEYKASTLLPSWLSSMPAIRRLRLRGGCFTHAELFALPAIEYIDLRQAWIRKQEPIHAPVSSTLRYLLLSDGAFDGSHWQIVSSAFLSTASPSLQQLSLHIWPKNDQQLNQNVWHWLATLHCLTALDLNYCNLPDSHTLHGLMSDDGQPVLSNLQRFSVGGRYIQLDDMDDNDDDQNDEGGVVFAVADFLAAHKRQLRHIKLVVTKDPYHALTGALQLIASSMPQLESLELTAKYPPVERKLSRGDVQPPQPPQPSAPTALSALRSLTLRNLAMSDVAVERLLSSCPQLLELVIDGVVPLTAAVWSSVLHCRQLLSLSLYTASVVATVSLFAVLSSSFSSESSTALPCLSRLVLAFQDKTRVDADGLTQLLQLLRDSPITTLALSLPDEEDVDWKPCLLLLSSLSHLRSIFLVTCDRRGPQPLCERDEVVGRLLNEHTQSHAPFERHDVSMRYHWHDGLLGVDEDELRAKCAVGVGDVSRRTYNDHCTMHYFKRARHEGEEDGRVSFFRSLRAVLDGTESEL